MARALIVGCGCRGLALASRLRDRAWEVRGTTRETGRLPEIQAAGVEAALADPDRPGTILDLAGDATIVLWLLGSATGEPDAVAAINGSRLERLLEKLVDSPVRGFLYEAAGTADRRAVAAGAAVVRAAGDRWRIPVEVVEADPGDPARWAEAMVAAVERLIATRY